MCLKTKFILIFWLLIINICHSSCREGQKSFSTTWEMQDTLRSHPAFLERVDEREKMVFEDIENYPYRPVSDRKVLQAMQTVPRHAFIPGSLQKYAYNNSPLPIGYNQTISQPYIVASMTEMLDLKGNEKVLEVGTGSGYQAAVLAEVCKEVYTIEIVPELGKNARKILEKLGYNNIHVRIGNGYLGWSEEAPFDRIMVTCAPEDIPEPLINQLKPGGMIVIPVGKSHQVQNLVIVKKNKNGRVFSQKQYPVRFVPMTGDPDKN
jgi:protein-L-isoaspartate(D-aspartate) O-methyltransferase